MNPKISAANILLFPLRRPFISLVLALWLLVTTFLGALQLSPEAQKYFNKSIDSYGYASASMILSSATESALQISENLNNKLSADLNTRKSEVADLKTDLKNKNSRLHNVDAFQKKANSIVKKHNIRLTKAVIKTAAGEIVAWIPAVGDVASVYFAIDGTIAMCNMFKELEATALKYGLPFYIYTDTFCEKPVEKTKEVISDTVNDVTTSVSESLRAQSESRTEYWSGTIEDFVNWINR